MEVGKGLAAVRKKHFPNHEVYFSFQMGGDPRTIRETLIGTMFEGDNDSDANMSADIFASESLSPSNIVPIKVSLIVLGSPPI